MNSKERVMLHRAMDAIKRGQNERGLEMLDKVLAMSPENADAWNDKGVALFRLGRVDESLEAYDHAISLDPENMEPVRNKGFVLRAASRFEEALEVYDLVLSRKRDAFDLESKATVLVGLGRLEEAAACIKEAITLTRSDRLEEELGALQSLIESRCKQ